ncbi:MAG: two-component system response regulator OmpR [Zoogloeaceae bacterium]|jgi:DNA-binding response OmpR family regulator|nr:two-component system response regulator OmpR [Zoogloeaceae bacterium]
MKEERPVRILVVDDDFRLRELLRRYLTEQGLEARVAADAEQMDRALAREHIDLMVLDLMLPGEDGLSICRRLRAGGGRDHRLPILMLTAKGDEIDRIIGLEMGADDYLPKPFNPRELLARIQAILRRQNNAPAGAPVEGDRLPIGQWTLDTLTRTLKKEGEEDIRLTTGEFALLSILATHPRQPMSRDQLMVDARGREMGPFDRAIDVQVSRLRKLIEPDPAKPRYLQTVWGVGYVFVPDQKAAE